MPFRCHSRTPSSCGWRRWRSCVAWWWARRPRPAMRFSDVDAVRGPRGGRRGWRCGAARCCAGWRASLLVLACAGPRRPDERTRLPAEAIAIVMAVDVSGSMDIARRGLGRGQPADRRGSKRRSARSSCSSSAAKRRTARSSNRARPTRSASSRSPRCREIACPLTLNHSVLLKMVDDLKAEGRAGRGHEHRRRDRAGDHPPGRDDRSKNGR